MNKTKDDIFKEYGAQKSILQALEELSVACLVNNVPGPSKIVFPMATLNFISKEAYAKQSEDQSACPVIKALHTQAFPGGYIELVTE